MVSYDKTSISSGTHGDRPESSNDAIPLTSFGRWSRYWDDLLGKWKWPVLIFTFLGLIGLTVFSIYRLIYNTSELVH
ncbi:hypothetical protein BMR1_01G02591 [Babesia microti strain RI]|uniref:Uncharacterized protein n=1 Tax=Babesia microti (strain RI) TaxID=1133968 RepID=A0A1N6LWZ9_BABMR|nr:hypothetical protein BMR1_01G02591 [Babesia microti strain RI]SIO73393.1 hypothetical protein BMR1_01G02591 [Babesia microti strain RI]|eukprot:XP_021337494.1 hypothetical protein BMR1_01G02591 [Babesia microti strain RI]